MWPGVLDIPWQQILLFLGLSVVMSAIAEAARSARLVLNAVSDG